MPKVKTRRSVKKKFKVTAKGKVLRRPAMRSHNLEKKSSKRKRGFRKDREVTGADRGAIKKMLGISTRSYLHTGEIRRYAERIAKIARTAKVLKAGTPLGIALSTASTALEIKEACSTGREEQCSKAKYLEVGKLGGSVVGGMAGGALVTALCFVVLGPTTGPVSLGCLLIGGGTGGAIGGSYGGALGETAGEKIYEY